MSLLINFFVNYPFVITPLIWGLIYQDFTLTRSGLVYYEMGYKNFIGLESYELNPRFQEAIHSKSSLPKFLPYVGLLYGFLIGVVFYILSLIDEMKFIFEIFLGLIMVIHLTVNIQHLANRRLFKYVAQNPNSIGGKIIMKNQFIYTSSKISRLQIRMIWIIALIFTQSYFILGAVFGETVGIFWISIWLKRIERKQSRALGWNQSFPELIEDEDEMENNKKMLACVQDRCENKFVSDESYYCEDEDCACCEHLYFCSKLHHDRFKRENEC